MVWQSFLRFGSSKGVSSVANLITITSFAYALIESREAERVRRINDKLKAKNLSLKQKNLTLEEEILNMRRDIAVVRGKYIEALDQYTRLETRSEQYLQAQKAAESCGLEIVVVKKK